MPDQGMVSLCIVCKERASAEPALCQGWESPGVLPTSPRGSSVSKNGLGVPLPFLNLCHVVQAQRQQTWRLSKQCHCQRPYFDTSSANRLKR